jgi:predicted nucleotidyltransferase
MKTINDVNLAPNDREALADATRILNERFPVAKVILFGSKSRCMDDTESDIDLLVLTEKALSWRERDAITDALFEVEMKHDVVISTLVATVDEWDKGAFSIMPIHKEIAQDGIVV